MATVKDLDELLEDVSVDAPGMWENENTPLLGEWWRTVSETTAPNLLDFNNVSAASVFTRWLGPGPTAQTLADSIRRIFTDDSVSEIFAEENQLF